MKNQLTLLFLGAGAFVCFIGYGLTVIDYVHDIRTGVYEQHPFEAIDETSALIIYNALGVALQIES